MPMDLESTGSVAQLKKLISMDLIEQIINLKREDQYFITTS